jgi:hypothetical protein
MFNLVAEEPAVELIYDRESFGSIILARVRIHGHY